MKKLIDGVLIDMTAKEISAKEAIEAQAAINRKTRIDAEADATTKKESGKQKLLDLGLSEDEVKAMIGI